MNLIGKHTLGISGKQQLADEISTMKSWRAGQDETANTYVIAITV